jgi:hypothetical protein
LAVIPDGFTWNQVTLERFHPINRALISLVAFRLQRAPVPIGTGFIFAAPGNRTIVATAAQVLNSIRHENTTRIPGEMR